MRLIIKIAKLDLVFLGFQEILLCILHFISLCVASVFVGENYLTNMRLYCEQLVSPQT